MSAPLWLAIDQGGGSTRALVFDDAGAVRASARRAVAESRPGPGRVEQDPEELVRSARECVAEVLAALGPERARVRAAGLATQRSSVVCWERDGGRALSAVLSWQDVRAPERLAPFRALGGELARRTGLVASPHYGASKLGWCLAHLPEVRAARARGTLALGPLASFLAQRLVHSHAGSPRVDPASASRTLLFALASGAWDAELCALAGVAPHELPRVVATRSEHGLLALERGAGHEIPLVVLGGDQSAALVARGRPAPDAAWINLGTGAFVQRALAEPPEDARGLLVSVAGGAPGPRGEGGALELVLEGTVNGAGSALAWAAERLGLDAEQALEGALAATPDPPLFVNAVSGLGAPFWRSALESRWVERAPADARARLAAVGESIVFLLLESLERMRALAGRERLLVATGGLARVDGLLARLATLAATPLERPRLVEATARGLAWLVRGTDAPWPDAAPSERFEPARGGPVARLAERRLRWRDALEEALAAAPASPPAADAPRPSPSSPR